MEFGSAAAVDIICDWEVLLIGGMSLSLACCWLTRLISGCCGDGERRDGEGLGPRWLKEFLGVENMVSSSEEKTNREERSSEVERVELIEDAGVVIIIP